MKLGLVIEESQGLQTHLNLRTDLTGSLVKMFSTTSCGRWFFLCRRLRGCGRGSLVWDIFSAEELFQENRVKSNLLCIALKHISFFFSFLFLLGYCHITNSGDWHFHCPVFTSALDSKKIISFIFIQLSLDMTNSLIGWGWIFT